MPVPEAWFCMKTGSLIGLERLRSKSVLALFGVAGLMDVRAGARHDQHALRSAQVRAFEREVGAGAQRKETTREAAADAGAGVELPLKVLAVRLRGPLSVHCIE